MDQLKNLFNICGVHDDDTSDKIESLHNDQFNYLMEKTCLIHAQTNTFINGFINKI